MITGGTLPITVQITVQITAIVTVAAESIELIESIKIYYTLHSLEGEIIRET